MFRSILRRFPVLLLVVAAALSSVHVRAEFVPLPCASWAGTNSGAACTGIYGEAGGACQCSLTQSASAYSGCTLAAAGATFVSNFSAKCVAPKDGQPAQCPTHYADFSTASSITGSYGTIVSNGQSCGVNSNAGAGPNNNGPGPCCAGNPVNVATGNKFQREVDIPSTDEGSLEFTRYYNSASDGYMEVGLGAGWMHNWARKIYAFRNVPGSSTDTSSTAVVYRPDGKILVFSQASNASPWTTTSDINDRLSGSPASGWTYITADNFTETYQPPPAVPNQVAAAWQANLVSVVSPNGRTTTLTYGKNAAAQQDIVSITKLVKVMDFRGRSLQFTYDASGRLSKITDSANGNYLYGYEVVNSAARRLTTVTYPDLNFRKYYYNETGKVPSGTTRLAALTGIDDENGKRFGTYNYGSDGKTASEQHAGGVFNFTFSYSAGSTTYVDPLGSSYTVPSTVIGNYTQPTGMTQNCPGCGGSSTRSAAYDSSRNPLSQLDFNGNLTCFTNDSSRNLELSRTEGLQAGTTPNAPCVSPVSTSATRTVTTQWHASWRLPRKLAEPLRITTYAFQGDAGVSCGATSTATVCSKTVQATTDTTGSAGFAATLSSDPARVWTYSYNAAGQVLSVNGPRTDVNDITTYAYYATNDSNGKFRIGDPSSITNALGQVVTFNEYDPLGRLTKSTDANGLESIMQYSPRGWLTSRKFGTTSAGYEQTTYDYYADGSLKRVTSPDASFINYTYDDAHRLTDVDDSLGNSIHYTLDNYGNRLTEETFDPSDVLTRKHQRTIDALNRVKTEIGGSTPTTQITTYGYDANGNRTSITDPLSRVTVQVFDRRNRMTSLQDPVNGASALTQFEFDGLDQLTKVTDPMGLATVYGVDGLGNQKSLASPDTGTAVSTFDEAGNLKTRTDARGVVAIYSYDAMNRVAQVLYPDETVTYAYDSCTNGIGRLCSISDKSGSTAFSYDVKGRVLSKTHTVGTLSLTMGYGYDSFGRLASVTTASGQVVLYGYSNGLLASVSLNGTTVLAGGTYAPFGPATGWTWGNNAIAPNSHVRSLDKDYRTTRVTSSLPASASQPAFDLQTGWDAASRVTSLQDMSGRLPTTSYDYDNLDRLTSATATGNTSTYGYNGVGDRTSSSANGAATTYGYFAGTHRLQSLSGAQSKSFGFDSAGNTTSSGGTAWTYGGNNRASTAGAATFDVNALGQRVRKSAAGAATRFAYDEAGHLWGEYDDLGNLVSETIWLADFPVALVRPGSGQPSVYYVHTDHLGTPREITQATDNQLVWRWDNTEPFGANAANESPAGLPAFASNLRFPGQFYDVEIGTHYNYFRDYDPIVGRYVESDPIGLWGGANTFGYVGAAPLSQSDPQGLVAPAAAIVPAAAAACGPACWATVAVLGAIAVIVTKCSSDPPKENPAIPADRIRRCREAWQRCMADKSVPESKCFDHFNNCTSHNQPYIGFPGKGNESPIR